MGDSLTGRGRCLCGSVGYTVSGELRDVVNCHCERCRRFTGHHMAATAAHPDSVVITDDRASLRWYDPVPGVHYGFCSQCGSSLFWKADAHPDRLSICAGTLDPPTHLHTTKAWWLAHRSDYFTLDESIENFEFEG